MQIPNDDFEGEKEILVESFVDMEHSETMPLSKDKTPTPSPVEQTKNFENYPKLDLTNETHQLILNLQKMHQIRLSSGAFIKKIKSKIIYISTSIFHFKVPMLPIFRTMNLFSKTPCITSLLPKCKDPIT